MSPMQLPQLLLDVRSVCALTTLGRTSLFNYVRLGKFPPPVRTGHRSIAWRFKDVMDWVDSLPSARPDFYFSANPKAKAKKTTQK